MLGTGIGQGLISYFMPIYVVNILGANDYIMGLISSIQVSTEIPTFYFSQKLTKRFGSRVLISFSLVAYILRFALYVIADKAIYIVLIESLHGLSFALFHVSAIIYVASLAPPGLETTAQVYSPFLSIDAFIVLTLR